MKRVGYTETNTCAIDIYHGFEPEKPVYNEGGGFDHYEEVEESIERTRKELLAHIALADECDSDTHHKKESGSFLVTLSKYQLEMWEPLVLEVGLEHIRTFHNPKSNREIRMYGYFRPLPK